MESSEPQLNETHNKQEFPPMHTAEHLLNQLMVRTFGCGRSTNAHIERKKSKISYTLPTCPTEEEIVKIVEQMNALIAADLPVTYEYASRHALPPGVSAERLPEYTGEEVRLVRIGDYDICPCIGLHVEHTAQIGEFILLGTNWDEERRSFRLRFKVKPAE